jgi:hypothetical protein
MNGLTKVTITAGFFLFLQGRFFFVQENTPAAGFYQKRIFFFSDFKNHFMYTKNLKNNNIYLGYKQVFYYRSGHKNNGAFPCARFFMVRQG